MNIARVMEDEDMTHVHKSNMRLDKIIKIRDKFERVNWGRVPCNTPMQASRMRRLTDPMVGENVSWTR